MLCCAADCDSNGPELLQPGNSHAARETTTSTDFISAIFTFPALTMDCAARAGAWAKAQAGTGLKPTSQIRDRDPHPSTNPPPRSPAAQAPKRPEGPLILRGAGRGPAPTHI